VRLDGDARQRYAAYVAQAKQYYRSVFTLDPIAKPLLGYYFALNITKAFLTAVAPMTTRDRLLHGLGDAFSKKQRYRFQQEAFRIRKEGVFRYLAERTGGGFCYSESHALRLVDLLPYLADAYDLLAEPGDQVPKLVPLSDATVLFGTTKELTKNAWLRIEIDRNILRQRNISPARLGDRARIFGSHFELVSSNLPTFSYESRTTLVYGQRRSEVLDGLCQQFDSSLIALQRYVTGGRRYIVLSTRPNLLSHESVTFAVMHHLSNMVRYRPNDVERLRGSKYFWLFAGWVDRACENYLLTIASRLTREEHLVV
jgi:hypothetical protein